MNAKDGTELTPHVVERLATEAEAGYDLAQARRIRTTMPAPTETPPAAPQTPRDPPPPPAPPPTPEPPPEPHQGGAS